MIIIKKTLLVLLFSIFWTTALLFAYSNPQLEKGLEVVEHAMEKKFSVSEQIERYTKVENILENMIHQKIWIQKQNFQLILDWLGNILEKLHQRERSYENKEIENESFWYEVPAENPNECQEFEKFDQEKSVCYLACQTAEECKKVEQIFEEEFEDEFEDLAEDYENFSETLGENEKNIKQEQNNNPENDDILVAEYKMRKWGEVTLIVWDKKNEKNKKVVEWVKKISPDTFSEKYINKIILLSTINNGAILAYVQQSWDKWDVVIAMDGFESGEKEVILTLIHEFTHIMTLNYSQIQDIDIEKKCKNYEVKEGCLKKWTYLSDFYHKFWKGKFIDDLENPAENYLKDPNAFLTEYSATSTTEDIAESFSFFVLEKKPKDSSLIKNQKLLFFYNYPELVKMRKNIRNKLIHFVREKKHN